MPTVVSSISGCCCNSSSSSGSHEPCLCPFPQAASIFTFTLAGVTNNLCFNCDVRNGTHTMVYRPTTNPFCFGQPCFWGELESRDFCNDEIGERWYLARIDFNSFDGWHLLSTQFCTTNPAGGGYYTDYQLIGVFNPVGSNTFTLVQAAGFCNMPATITIDPSGVTMTCSE